MLFSIAAYKKVGEKDGYIMDQCYANIIVDITHEKLDRIFQYRIPDQLREKVQIGSRVNVPFGKGDRLVAGYVIGLEETPSYDPSRIKEIGSMPEDGITVETHLIALAAWMRRTYGSTMIQALKTVVPVKEKRKSRARKHFLLLPEKALAERILEEYRKKHYTAKARLLEALIENGELEEEQVTGALRITASVWKGMESQKILQVIEETVYRNPFRGEMQKELQQNSGNGDSDRDTVLTEEQTKVCDGITEEWKNADRPVLLQGVTGSGKTLVYIELIRRMLQNKKEAIVLVPEIALTWQTVRRFYRQFGDQVTVLHSRMTPAERYDQFERVKKGKVRIMIGPRSALFTPFPHLGLIVIDEEQEHTYRSEGTPRYDARETAICRARLEGAHVVMGSATPSVDSSYRSHQGIYARFLLKSRFGDALLPSVEVADMREELRQGNRSLFSRTLRGKMERCLAEKEQIMLFLNRRGHTGFISCRSCGHVIRCPHCDVSLTQHANGKMICHYCGYEEQTATACPSCGSPYIGGFRAGTQQVEEAVRRIFPQARILRMDADSTRGKEGYEKILHTFAAGEADILIGTQMIVKGHDFPGVTLVGILAADVSLFAGDFCASENTYQLLVQAAGRAGRGAKAGEAVIQTYHPENPCIQAAIRQDYDAFYREEIAVRQLMGYPPVSHMLAVHASCGAEEILNMAMGFICKYLMHIADKGQTCIIGPAPESVSKIQDQYRRVLYVKDGSIERLIVLRQKLEKYIEINPGFAPVNIQYDVLL